MMSWDAAADSCRKVTHIFTVSKYFFVKFAVNPIKKIFMTRNTDGRLCYISRSYKDCRTAGNKAKSDYEDIMAAAGGVNLGLRRSYGRGAIATFARNLAGVVRFGMCVRKGDTVVLQYPVKKYFSLLCRLARLRGARTVALVHDLGSCRRRKLTVAQEMRRLGRADVVAATNGVMARWLEEQGMDAGRLEALGLHDYLCDARPAAESAGGRPKMSVAYAGSLNMRKNSFLLRMAEIGAGLRVELYGSLKDYRPADGAATHIREHGFVEPEAFIAGAEGAWGLVWDGDSLDGCTGDWGEYLRLNTPHKSAFYLRAGLPLIVWSKAAIAPIVRERGLGLCVDSLRELPEAIGRVSAQEYERMRAAALAAGEEAAAGANLLGLLDRTGS